MNSWWHFLVGFPVGIAAAWWLIRRKTIGGFVAPVLESKKAGPVVVTRNEPRQHTPHYYGAFVQLGVNPCDAVKAISDQRYLADEAPRFPLPGCNREECRCMMRPQDDRRAGYDRRGDSFSAYGNFEIDRHTQKRDEKSDRRYPS